MDGNSKEPEHRLSEVADQLRDLRGQCALAVSDLDLLLEELQRFSEPADHRGHGETMGQTGE